MKMWNLCKTAIIISALFGTGSLYAEENLHPKSFTTKNYTKYYSNVKIKNTWTPFPTPPGNPQDPAVRSVPWLGLKLLCHRAEFCTAELWMKTNTDNPVYIGEGVMNVNTGEITPKELVSNGFKLTSPEPGVIELRDAE